MFGTMMKCPENEQEAIEMVYKMEEDASRWGNCGEDSEELECSDDDEATYDIRSHNEGTA